tara:strand:- start:88 stop:960 length:873 start_codon:yes stop_codon:yes gene_type:complete
MKEEFSNYYPDIVTHDIKKCDIIWIIAPWMWKKIPKKYLKSKTVVCSIHHLEKKDYSGKPLKEFYKRDKYVDFYHTISEKSKIEIQKLTSKKIVSIPFWINENIFFPIENKSNLRSKYNLQENSFIIGSFQRDTEGKDLKSPKLIKGPDRFVEIVKSFTLNNENLVVLLSGYRRQYVIKKLEEQNINYIYVEMVDFEILNELYNCLDLYIVSSRIEGGPQAILECGITETPIISTDVGVASEILANESIFNMENYEEAKPNIEVALSNSVKYSMKNGMSKYLEMFTEVFK